MSVEIRVIFFFMCRWNKEYLDNLNELVVGFGFAGLDTVSFYMEVYVYLV